MGRLADEVRARPLLPAPAQRKAIRKAVDATIDEVARELGVHRVTVARWESGDREPCGARKTAYAVLLRELNDAAILRSFEAIDVEPAGTGRVPCRS